MVLMVFVIEKFFSLSIYALCVDFVLYKCVCLFSGCDVPTLLADDSYYYWAWKLPFFNKLNITDETTIQTL